jgi:predicted nucleic-acid-binding protein
MAYKTFADTNVFLDHLLERTADWEFARDVFVLAEQKEITVLTSSSSLVNVIYGLKQQKKLTKENIVTLITYLLSYTYLAHTNETIFISALASGFTDLEDAIQYHTALQVKGIDYFITSNTKDYKKALPQLPVMTPKQFMMLYKKKN